MPANARVTERSLVPELSLVDIEDDLVWHKDGSVTLMYRVAAYHEPGMDDEAFNATALLADNVWSGLPEGTSYQFLVMVDHARGVETIRRTLPAIPDSGATARLLEEFRQARVADLVQPSLDGSGVLMVQERRHYLCATFRPSVLRSSLWRDMAARARAIAASAPGLARFARGRHPGGSNRFETAYEQVRREAATFDHRVMTQLAQQGLELVRCRTEQIVAVVYEMLNPSVPATSCLRALPRRARRDRDGLPPWVLEELPYLGDTSPVWSLFDDDLLVRQRHLQLGDSFATVISLKELPDRTEPGVLVPLLRLNRERYRVVYRVDIPQAGAELAALRAKANVAEGMRLENMIVDSRRADPHAEAVGRQSDEAMRRMIASTQRIFGVWLQVQLLESSPEALDEAVQEVLGVMARAHGLRGRRETFLLKEAFLSSLPGAPPLIERRRKALTPVVTDLMPVYDFRTGQGKVPLLTPNNSIVLFDPFAKSVPNYNVLITGLPGAGKSVLAQVVLSGVEMANAAHGEAPPYVFILDNGASYERYMRLRDDGRYVRFDFAVPPGVDVFKWSPEDGDLDEHVSRLEWLLLDLLHVDASHPERFERKKAAVEEALRTLYVEGHEQTFAAFAAVLQQTAEGAELGPGLYPFAEGKFARLCQPNPDLALSEDVRAVCYDFKGLEAHPDFAFVALRLVIYQVRRFAARVSQRGRRTFLLIDESWSMLDPRGGQGHTVTAQAAPFISASVRMGRKEGMSVIGLSQRLADFQATDYGAAIIENSSTKFIGYAGASGLESLRAILQLSERQIDQVRRLRRTPRYHEFLLIQDEVTHVVRVPLDRFSRWVFTTAPRDRDRIAQLAESQPQLSLLEQMRHLAGEG